MIVLLVEPDTVMANIYAEALQSVGHKVIYSPNAQTAIFAADAQIPDLVIIELQLVSNSGIEFLYEFRSYSEWQAIPAIVISQVPPTEFIDSWQLLREELGVVDYLYKPQTTLVKLLRSVQNNIPAKAGTQ